MNNKNAKELKDTTIKMFEESIADTGLSNDIKLKIVNRNIFSKKPAFVILNAQKAVITLNLDHILEKDTDQNNATMQIYKTLQHELEHIKMIFFNQKEDLYNYNHLMGLMEYLYYSNLFKNKFSKIPFLIYNYLFLKNQINKNDDCSPLEITADLVGYSETKNFFDKIMMEEDKDNYDKIISSLAFLNDNFEIFYDLSNDSVNRFYMFTLHTNSYLSKNLETLEKYGILRNIFHEDGSLKSVYELYTEINPENEKMYNRLIIDYFTSFRDDYSEYFKDNSFKTHVEKLFNDYIENAILYYNNIDLGTIFVNNRQVLVDNLKMKKRNVLVLNSISKLYGLNSTTKNILDSDHIYTYKKEHISIN